MITNPEKSRRATRLVVSAFFILMLFTVVWMCYKPERLTPRTFNASGSLSLSTETSDYSAPSSFVVPKTAGHVTERTSAVAEDLTAPTAASNGDNRRNSTLRFRPPATDVTGAYGEPLTGLGVVNLERLFTAYQLTAGPGYDRAKLLLEIRRLVELRAMEHKFSLVIDGSAKTPNDTRFMLTTNGAPDITDEVLQGLNP
jgi:hypothetical protein